jgi:hypothetical protein
LKGKGIGRNDGKRMSTQETEILLKPTALPAT